MNRRTGNGPLAVLIIIVAVAACFAVPYAYLNFRNSGAVRQTPSSAPSSAAPSSVAPASSEAESAPAEQVSLAEAARPLHIAVSISKQDVTVFDAQNRIVRHYVCSTGKDGLDTPTGTFTVSDRGDSFYSETEKEGAYYWTRFKGTFLFHSVPFGPNRKIKPEEQEKLGTKASHGCVRLALENAKWIYDNIPDGTKVTVQN